MLKVVLSAGDTISNSAIRTSIFESGGQTASRALAEGLLRNLGFGLIRGCLLIVESFGGARIRRRRRNVRGLGACIRSLRKATSSLLGGHVLHAIVELLLEMIVHLLQVVDGNCHLLARRAILLFAAGNTGRHFLVVIGRIGNSGDDVSARQRAFLAVARHREIGIDDEGSPRGIESGRYFSTGLLRRRRSPP